MPIPSPFHARTAELCTSLRWKEWAGYHAVCSYDTCHEPEYHAFRHAAGLLDVTPLYKVDVRGPEAAAFLAWLTVRDVTRLRPLQVWYLCWCDEAGKVVDDGTVTRLEDDLFRLTSAEPAFAWLARHAGGWDVAIADRSEDLGALAVQGPTARAVLRELCGPALEDLRFFRAAAVEAAGARVLVTRTGYTGDLGYELWVERGDALRVWDALLEAGAPHRLQPAGLDALDVTRIEAGFFLGGVDYVHALQARIPAQLSTPDELGLGWMVQPEREPFLGRDAIRAERARGAAWSLVGLVLDWDEFEALHDAVGLPPEPGSGAWRASRPVHDALEQVGFATSGAWSPVLKQGLALATVRASRAAPGTALRLEVTVEHCRHLVTARVAPRPFFDPGRKKA